MAANHRIRNLLLGQTSIFAMVIGVSPAHAQAQATPSQPTGQAVAAAAGESATQPSSPQGSNGSAPAQLSPANVTPTSQPPTAATGAGNGNGEIVVTAQRREQRLLDVPVSVAVFSGNQLDIAQVHNLKDLQYVSPNFVANQGTDRGSTFFFMRGVGTQVQDRGFEQSVGIYIDGVYRSRPGSALMDLQDISQVEVLRGPQSTLFGRNNLVGAISVTTQRPSFTFGGTAEATYGNYNTLVGKLSLTGPITDKVAFRLNVQHVQHDGYIKNIAPGSPDLDSVNDWGARGQILVEPSDKTTLRLIGDWSHAHDICCAAVKRFVDDGALASGLAGSPPGPATPGVHPVAGVPGVYYDPWNRVVSDNGQHFEKITDYGLSAELNHKFEGATLIAIGSYRRYKFDQVTDVVFNDNKLFHIPVTVKDDFPEHSLEVRLASSGPSRLEWIGGFYYFHQELREDNSFLAVGVHYNAVQKTNSGAVFGQATYHIDNHLSLTGGLRYLIEHRQEVSVGVPPAATLGTLGTVHDNAKALMGTAVLGYKANDNANFYAKYSRGFLVGAINLFISSPAVQANPSVRPTTNDSFELGAKVRLFDRKLDLNAAAFYETIKDQQVQSFRPPNTFIVQNAAKIRAKGIEVDATAHPTRQLSLSTGIVLQKAVYADFQNAPVPQYLAPITIQDLTGKPTPQAPTFSLTGSIQYQQPLGHGLTLTPSLTTRHTSSFFTDLTDNKISEQGGNLLVDASIELAKSGRWSLQFWGKNITNAHIIRGGGGSVLTPFSFGYQLIDPPTYGVSARVNF